MNERIKELAKAHLVHERYTQSVGEDLYEFYSDELEKFAELIVRECADWIDSNVGMIDEEARRDLLNHFGIKNETSI